MSWVAEKPDRWANGVAIILGHGAGQGMDSPFMNFFHKELANRGFLSVKFNFDYMEQGRKAPDPQPKLQARYRQVIAEVAEAHTPGKIIIGGKSMGGRVASYIAGDATLISVGPTGRVSEVHRVAASSQPAGPPTPHVAGLVFLGYPLHPPAKTSQLRDEHLYSLNVPMLFLSGAKDNFAERDLLTKVVGKIGDRATLHWIEGGDHSLMVRRSGKDSWPEALDTIGEWIQTH